MKKTRIIIFGGIVIICFIAIGVGLYIQFTENDYKKAIEKTNSGSEISEDEISKLKNNFDNIFQNDITGANNNVQKKDESLDVVYISAEKVELIPNKYDLDVQIPQINLQNSEIEKCNTEIKSLFQNKTANILAEAEEYTVFKVKFHTYINENILSLVIKANLKEGTKPEREIIKTYNINLENNKLLSLNDIIENKNLDKSQIQDKINTQIKKQKDYEKSLANLGYEIYTRNAEDDMYKLENTDNFILGEKSHLYIIYAYGNNNFTSETDIIIM